MQRTDSLGKTLMLGKIEGRRRGWQRMRWLMASPTRWTWVWASPGSWWWTGKLGVLQSMGSQRVRHDWATELNWTYFYYYCCSDAQLCLTLCDPVNCSLPGSSVHGILQARILEWVAVPSSRGSSWPRDQTHISCTAGRFFTAEPPKKLKGKFTLTSNCSPLLCHVGKSSNPLISFEPVFLSFYNLYEKCSLCYSSINIVHSKSTDNF